MQYRHCIYINEKSQNCGFISFYIKQPYREEEITILAPNVNFDIPTLLTNSVVFLFKAIH